MVCNSQAQAVIETLVDGVISISSEGIIGYVNPAVEKIFGYSKAELIGENVNILMPSPHREDHNSYIEEYTRTEEKKIIGYGRQVEGLRKDGSIFPLDLSVSEVVVNEKKVFTGVVRDITERRQVEDEIKRQVDIRTQELAEANEKLLAEISEKTRAEGKLHESLKEKEILLKEIHHRVKNNLQLISSLLKLHVRRAKDISADDLIKEVHNRIQSIALLHEMLYQAEDLGAIDFAEYMESLVQSLLRYYGMSRQVNVQIKAESTSLDLERSIPCGLIVNELVTNSLTHAFPRERQGNLWLELKRIDNNYFSLVVRDDGVGLPECLDLNETDSLGLELVRKLTKQLKGQLEVERGPGAQFIITLPV